MTLFKKHLYGLKAYHPPLEGRNPKAHTLLDFNERTVPVGPAVKESLARYLDEDRLQVYPAYGDLVARIAAYVGVEPECVMLTNGSDQGIEVVYRATCREGDEVILPTPSFAMYTQCALVEGLVQRELAFTDDFRFPTQAVLESISPRTRLIVIPNPNNPTGTPVPHADILRIAAAARGAVVLVDECYFEYTQETVARELDSHPNLVITRTFSKTWGLPSTRMGYVVSRADNIEQLLKVRGPYDVNTFGVVAVKAALENPDYMRAYVDEILREAKPFLEDALRARGIPFWPSAANYLLTFPKAPETLESLLREQGFLVRPRRMPDGRLALRITVGTLEQMKRLSEVLPQD